MILTTLKNARVLICDDDPLIHQAIKYALKTLYDIKSAFSPDEALTLLKKNTFDIVLLDIEMDTPQSGIQLIPKILEIDSEISIIMNSGRKEFSDVRDAMRLGALDYVVKGEESDQLLHRLKRAAERKKLIQKDQNFRALELRLQNKFPLIGGSAALQSIKKQIEKFKKSDANILIYGETGTGKEVVARHLRGITQDQELQPFIAVDSSTIQQSTAESVLFGHEKGAFTGAEGTKKGVFEVAHGGIVYFDEIANMPLDIQAKLLRVIQEKEVMRLGSAKTIPLEFRVVSASNQDLEKLCKEGKFKDDLLQRLNVLPIILPPLRERTEDIPELLIHFSKRFARGDLSFTIEAIDTLKRYTWPGNVRELGNLVAYLFTMMDENEVDVADLPAKFRGNPKPEAQLTSLPLSNLSATRFVPGISFYDHVAQYEKVILNQAIDHFEKNISKTAMGLEMDRSHLYSKLKEHDLFQKNRIRGPVGVPSVESES